MKPLQLKCDRCGATYEEYSKPFELDMLIKKCGLCGDKHTRNYKSFTTISKIQFLNIMGIPVSESIDVCEECVSKIIDAVIEACGINKDLDHKQSKVIEHEISVGEAIIIEDDETSLKMPVACVFTCGDHAVFLPYERNLSDEDQLGLAAKMNRYEDPEEVDDVLRMLERTFDINDPFYNAYTMSLVRKYHGGTTKAAVVLRRKLSLSKEELDGLKEQTKLYDDFRKGTDEL